MNEIFEVIKNVHFIDNNDYIVYNLYLKYQ